MAQRERDAHAWMRKVLKIGGSGGARLTRVENLLFDGTPDTNGCIGGTEFWLEIKAPREPARLNSYMFRNNSNHKFTQGQKNFALEQLNAGGNMWAFIATDVRRLLVPGVYIEHLNDMTVDEAITAAVWINMVGDTLRPASDRLRQCLSQPSPRGINHNLFRKHNGASHPLQVNPF